MTKIYNNKTKNTKVEYKTEYTIEEEIYKYIEYIYRIDIE